MILKRSLLLIKIQKEQAMILLDSMPDLFVLSLGDPVSYELKRLLNKTYIKLNFSELGVPIATYGGMSSVIIYKKLSTSTSSLKKRTIQFEVAKKAGSTL